MKKIVWIDVGSHFGQEYSSIFFSSYYYKKILITLLGHLFNGRLNKFLSFAKELPKNLKINRMIKDNDKSFYKIFIEANINVINQKKRIYKKIDLPLNLAIIDNNNEDSKLVKLYIANNNYLSQGSSIFKSKKNVNDENYIYTLGVPADLFFKKIKNHLDKILENYEILLRLNCEGVEDEIIYSCEKIFNKKLKLIMGAVDDVKKIKSEIIYNDLIIFMEEKNLKFTYFTPDPNTWLKAHETIYKTFKLSK